MTGAPNAGEVRQVLFVSFSNLGDALLSLPALDALARLYPAARIDVVCGPGAAAVFQGDPRVRTVHVDIKRPLSRRVELFKKVFLTRYDRVVDLRRSLFRFLGKKGSSGWAGDGSVHMRDRHLNAVRALGANVEPFRFTSSRSMDPGALSGRTAVIAPGSKSTTKEWPAERFARLADRLIREDGLDVIWIGDERERGLIEGIRAQMAEPSANFSGRLSWPETMELIRGSAVVITNDSAPLHAADHIGKKTVAIFGPTDPERYGPQRSPSGVLFKGIACSPCGQAQCRYGHRRCLTDITVEDVYRRARHLLEDAPDRDGLKVLVVRLDRIGDVMLSFPAVAAIRQKFPNARITWLVRPAAQELAERCPDSDEVLVYDYTRSGRHRGALGALALLRQLARRRFDMAFLLHPTLRTHLMAALSGIPYRAGYDARGGWLLTHRIADLRRDGYQHESRYAQDVVRALNVPPTDAVPRLLLYAEDAAAAADLLRKSGLDPERPYAVFHAAASCRSKCWPAASFAALGLRLQQERGLQIVLAGDPSSAAVNAALAQRIPAAADLSGLTPLMTLAALCRSAAVVVSNDSGPAHVAAAAGARVLSIFGRKEKGLSERRWSPMGPGTRALRKDVGCVVCLADRCPIGFECLNALGPDDVFRAADALIASETPASAPAAR